MRYTILTLFSLLCLASASFIDNYTPKQPHADNSTYGNIEQMATTHVHLDWTVDFDRKVISGAVTHDLDIIDNTQVLVIDAWNIKVSEVKLLKAGAAHRMRTYGTSVFTTQFEYDEYSLGSLEYKIDTYNELIG